MKRLPKILLPLALAIVTMSFINMNDWVLFTSHGFSAMFPQTPDVDSQFINSPLGNLKFNSFMYDASADSTDENLVYGAMMVVYPDSVAKAMVKPEVLRGLFDGAVKGGAKEVNGKIISEKEINFEGYPGREAKIDFQDGLAIIRMRIYQVGITMYTLETITYTAKDDNKSIDRFMNSFRLVK